MELRHLYVRECHSRGMIIISFVTSTENLADRFTRGIRPLDFARSQATNGVAERLACHGSPPETFMFMFSNTSCEPRLFVGLLRGAPGAQIRGPAHLAGYAKRKSNTPKEPLFVPSREILTECFAGPKTTRFRLA
ncbi:MAG: hypothetical protein BJ554DRAFT_5304 [Olpidium bornovanus]|uniref:Uncharacterized protein n=1 Tax=Olpidium bornovanus TaxID=278681 RepID=A0A8H8A012_9FUNG|nr:MAG: hypothetical protein BJ554DRAFT_5304 [Olpidium bornovanus]